MTYLLDTDYIVDYFMVQQDAIELLPVLIQHGVGISLLTFGEIYEGIYYGRNPQKAEEGFQHFLSLVDVLPLNQPIMQGFARIRGELRRTGQIIGDCDILIAATALQHDLTLVTRNLKHYQRIPHLQIYQ